MFLKEGKWFCLHLDSGWRRCSKPGRAIGLCVVGWRGCVEWGRACCVGLFGGGGMHRGVTGRCGKAGISMYCDNLLLALSHIGTNCSAIVQCVVSSIRRLAM